MRFYILKAVRDACANRTSKFRNKKYIYVCIHEEKKYKKSKAIIILLHEL